MLTLACVFSVHTEGTVVHLGQSPWRCPRCCLWWRIPQAEGCISSCSQQDMMTDSPIWRLHLLVPSKIWWRIPQSEGCMSSYSQRNMMTDSPIWRLHLLFSPARYDDPEWSVSHPCSLVPLSRFEFLIRSVNNLRWLGIRLSTILKTAMAETTILTVNCLWLRQLYWLLAVYSNKGN